MAWVPTTDFEDDLVSMQLDLNLLHSQLAFEENRKTEYAPRPQSTYDYLERRAKRNEELENTQGPLCKKSKEIRSSLAMMERLQQIAGTKPLGEHATMADWEDRSTVEKEARSMIRHFGLMSMAGVRLTRPPESNSSSESKKIHYMRNGIPLILDPKFFEPGKKRVVRSSENSSIKQNSLDSDETGSSNSLYASAKTHLDESQDGEEI
ncbi:squ, partial [Drosophila busckii]